MAEQSGEHLRSQVVFVFVAFAFGMMLSALLLQKNQAQATKISPLLTFKGSDKFLEDLPPAIAGPYHELDQTLRRKQLALLEAAAWHYVLSEQAQQQGISLAEANTRLLASETVTDEEVNAFYAQHQATLKRAFFEVRHEIAALLLQQKQQARRQQILADLQARGDLGILLEPLPPLPPKAIVPSEG